MNMLALRCGDDIVVIDAGLMFPGGELLGVDIVVPDLTYLVDNREHVRGLILTHCHEDHIGAVPYVLSQLDPPIYCTRYTKAMVERRLKEHDLENQPALHEIGPRGKVRLGCFEVEFIHVTHSTVDTVALAIHTPLGIVIHTGDFKIDLTPIDDKPFDIHAFAECGKQGVLLLLSDSTNVEREGFTPSERVVRPRLEDLFVGAKDSVFLSCFSSATHRIQQIINLSAAQGRKLAIIGRSMQSASEIAHDLGLLNIPDNLFVRPQDLEKLPRSQRTVLIAGSQGEPLSSLARAALGKHRHADIEQGDTVILSARLIPGNEKAVFRMIDHLYKRGAQVIYGDMNPPVHVSGHASQEELKLMLSLTRPKYFVPLHGDYRQLSRHIQLAGQVCGPAIEGSFLLQSGDVLEISDAGARRLDPVPVGRICIDLGTGDEIVEELVIRDRRHVSEFGIIIPIVALNRHTGELEGGPEVVTRGFVVPEDDSNLLPGARECIAKTVETSSKEEKADWGVMEEKIRADLKRYIARETSSRPLILPVILET
jgi:ribonuclease J